MSGAPLFLTVLVIVGNTSVAWLYVHLRRRNRLWGRSGHAAVERWNRSAEPQSLDGRRLAQAEDRYVRGDLELPDFERQVEMILGIRDLEHERRVALAKAESQKRVARSTKGVLLNQQPQFLAVTDTVAMTSVGVTPRIVHPATLEPVECHELVDATGKIIARYPKTA